jgi:uncharacterized OB-fold protein
MNEAVKPGPLLDMWWTPFWQAAREGRLVVQKCNKVGKLFFPPMPVSPYSRKPDWKWVEVKEGFSVLSFVKMHQRYFEGFAKEIPYVIAQIALGPDAMMISNVVGDVTNLRIGDRLKLTFESRPDGWKTPQFVRV